MKFARWGVFAAIIAFWAMMWSLLIRSEWRPGEAALHALPPELVLRQYFEHEQVSPLFVRDGGQPIGHLRLDPKVLPDGYSLALVGGLELTTPGSATQRAGFDVLFEMDRAFHLRVLHGTFSRRAAPTSGLIPLRVEFSADFTNRRGHYLYEEDNVPVLEQDFTLDEDGLREVLEKWGFSPEWKEHVPAVTAGAIEVRARQVRLTLHDEPTEATQVTFRLGGQTWLDLSLSPLGQVHEVQTLWGWTLSAE